MSAGVRMVILGTSQDGGVPQAGCSCTRCHNALENPKLRIHPTSCAIIGSDGSINLLEATRNLAEQLGIVSSVMGYRGSLAPDSVCITHFHLGHVDGLGQFGKEAMGVDSIPFFSSSKAMNVLENSFDSSNENNKSEEKNEKSSHSMFVTLCEDRDKLQKYLERFKIQTRVYYKTPLHLYKVTKYLKYKKGDLPKAEEFSKKFLSLPYHQHLSKSQIRFVCKKINDFYG